jgi:hypothetical protein
MTPYPVNLVATGVLTFFLRMLRATFEFLINLVGHKLCKQDTNFRDSIPMKERVVISLRFLAIGDYFQSLMYVST